MLAPTYSSESLGSADLAVVVSVVLVAGTVAALVAVPAAVK